MRLIPSKTLVRHAEDSTSPAPSGSWLNYWSETLGVEFPQSGYVKCDCCKKYHLITDFVGAHVVNTMDGKTYIYPTCKNCNDTYKNSKAPEGIFFAFRILPSQGCFNIEHPSSPSYIL